MIFYPSVFPITKAKDVSIDIQDAEEQENYLLQQEKIARGIDGERLIYETLQKIDKDWIVFYSYRLISAPRFSDEEYDKEIDFLLLIPEKGLICLEVKNHRHPHPNAKLPIVQVNDAKWTLVNWLKNVKKIDTDSFEHRAAVLMINGADRDQKNDKMHLCSLEDCTDPQRLEQFILKQFKANIGADEETIDKLHEILKRPQIYNISLRDYDYIMQKATANMGRILPMLVESRPGINVTGCAGSGKTVMALQEACRLAKQGKKVLYLCFNRNLGIWLRHSENVRELGNNNNLVIRHIHKFITDILHERFHYEDLTEEQLLDIQLYFLNNPETTYDYVFVDEAQDFLKSYWDVVQCAMKPAPHGCLYTFSDEEQKLRETNTTVTKLPTKVCLSTNLRNSQQIARYGSSIIENEHIEALNLKAQKVKILSAIESTSERAAQVQEIVEELLTPSESHFPVTKNQIVVLSPWNIGNVNNCCFNHLPKGYLIPEENAGLSRIEERFDQTIFKQKAKRILAETIKGFKGLEADFVIITDIPTPGRAKGFSLADFYVACSRAKYGLYIIPANKEAEEYARSLLPSEDN